MFSLQNRLHWPELGLISSFDSSGPADILIIFQRFKLGMQNSRPFEIIDIDGCLNINVINTLMQEILQEKSIKK